MKTVSVSIFLAVCLLVRGSTGVAAQKCASFDPACPSLVYAATVALPSCPDGSEWDESSASCLLPCSSRNTVNVTYTASRDDYTRCVPTCPAGHTSRPAPQQDSISCIRCGPSGVVTGGKKGNWVCRRGSQTTMPVSTVVLPIVSRAVVEGGCPQGATVVSGVCAKCAATCDPYLSKDPSVAPYLFYQAEGATFCVPNECCLEESWLVENDD